MRVVCRVSETGSVSKAAAALGVSQPSLTAQLHRIEEAIGGPLFDRGSYGVTPTPLGRHVLRRARAMLVDMDDLLGSSRRYTDGPRTLRLGSLRTVMFGTWMARMEDLMPDREFTTQVDVSSATLTELLAADVLDVVMIGRCDDAHAPPCPPGVREQTMVHPEPYAVALPVGHRLAGRTDISLTDLAEDIWICPPAGKEDGDLASLRDACERLGFTPQFRYYNLDSIEIEQLIGAGRGISLCAPTMRDIPSSVILPLVGHHISWRRVLRFRPESASQEDIDLIHKAFTDTYRTTIAENALHRPWWDSHPDTHPTVIDP
ncbi:LysR family transcriptional regulator [Kribbella qitaiheensis]|uniref:LysR family transcriptional regulator n=1 Tax=Kribbella qitaiheensis TaxID=1544730 RepID=A0A7G6X966_9ACTN|nr:LysR family transcriptional regulator [Kribbella qitaiheensis]